MADEHHHKSHEYETTAVGDEGAVETKDRGLFDFLGKKEEEKPQDEVIVTEFEKVTVSEPEYKVEEQKEEKKEEDEEEKKHGLLEKLRRSDSSSSSSSDEEEGEGVEKKKKKKEKKGKKKVTDEKEEEKHEEDTSVPVVYEEVAHPEPAQVVQPEEKKGFLEKIKDKLPGQHKKTEEAVLSPPAPPAEYTAAEASPQEVEAKEKKGIFEKIKEKLPGYHPKTEEEKEKEKEKDSASY